MLRFILVMGFATLFLIISIPIFGIEWIIGKLNHNAKEYSSLRILQWGLRTAFWLTGAKATIIGKENLIDETCLYVSNHRSIVDIALLYPLCKNPTGFISKKSMGKIPSFRTWLLTLHGLLLDREDPRQGMKVILQAIENVKAGICMCIFPEGTRKRTEDGNLLPFHDGSFKIATKTGCPIIPIAINNSSAVFEDQFPRIKPAKVIVEICKPIYPSELDKETLKHIGKHCQNIIQETINKNKSLL